MKPVINLAIIPARGGSKSIKKKNLIKLGRNTLIEITVHEIIQSKVFDRIVLTSDSEEILDHAKSLDIDCIKRPKKISLDGSSSEDAVAHVLKKYSTEFNVKNFGLFQPTSPFRQSHHIIEAYDSFAAMQNKTLISVEKIEKKYLKLFYTFNNKIKPILKEMPFMPRQQLPDAFLPNGAIYLSQSKHFIKNHSFFSDTLGLFEMSSADSLDIDSKEDLIRARAMLENKEN